MGLTWSNLSLSRYGGGNWQRRRLCTRRNTIAVHNTINSVLLLWALLLLKKFPSIGISPRPGTCWHIRHPVVDQSCDHKALPVLQFELASALRVLRAGTVKPEMVSALAKSSCADLRRYPQMDIPVGQISG